jgi:hypothetical protein
LLIAHTEAFECLEFLASLAWMVEGAPPDNSPPAWESTDYEVESVFAALNSLRTATAGAVEYVLNGPVLVELSSVPAHSDALVTFGKDVAATAHEVIVKASLRFFSDGLGFDLGPDDVSTRAEEVFAAVDPSDLMYVEKNWVTESERLRPLVASWTESTLRLGVLTWKEFSRAVAARAARNGQRLDVPFRLFCVNAEPPPAGGRPPAPAPTMRRRVGRLKKVDSEAINAAMAATTNRHESLMDDPAALAALCGTTPNNARRWIDKTREERLTMEKDRQRRGGKADD